MRGPAKNSRIFNSFDFEVICYATSAIPTEKFSPTKMATNEPASEMIPAIPAPAVAVSPPRPARVPSDYLALAIATCGVGYLPLAPGTWGSLVGVGIYLVLLSFLRFSPWAVFIAVELVLITAITLVGFWAGSRTEKLLGRKDPGKVVIDEVAGQLIALLPIVPGFDPGWVSIIAAFLLFRFFDIIKPYPARRLEKLESGLGIMCDDLVAGAYAAVGTAVLIAVGMLFILNS